MLSLHLPRSLPQDREVGAAICQAPGGRLRLGPLYQGDAHGVDIPLRCASPAQAIGTWHTHPGGSPAPSSLDDREARRLNLRLYCTTQPWTGETICKRL